MKQTASSLKDFEVLSKLGEGSFGIVFKVQRKLDANKYVLKKINISKMNTRCKEDALNEVRFLSKLEHPNIVKYYDSFIEEEHLYIVMEYCEGGDLSKFLRSHQDCHLKEELVWKYIIQMCQGLSFIHQKKILHRDIKAMNIFISSDDQIRIGDLGVAKALQNHHSLSRTTVGTPLYMSPEICEERSYNEKSDIWALGCVIYEICAFKHPFEAKTFTSLVGKIVSGQYAPIPSIYSKELAALVDACLQKSGINRPAAEDILKMPSVLQKIKHYNIHPSAFNSKPIYALRPQSDTPQKPTLSGDSKALTAETNKKQEPATLEQHSDSQSQKDSSPARTGKRPAEGQSSFSRRSNQRSEKQGANQRSSTPVPRVSLRLPTRRRHCPAFFRSLALFVPIPHPPCAKALQREGLEARRPRSAMALKRDGLGARRP